MATDQMDLNEINALFEQASAEAMEEPIGEAIVDESPEAIMDEIGQALATEPEGMDSAKVDEQEALDDEMQKMMAAMAAAADNFGDTISAQEESLPELEPETMTMTMEEVMPELETEAPVVEEPIPEPELEASVVEEPIPEPELEAPVEEEPMPELEQEAPVEEEPMPELEQEVPVEEEPMPELEQEAPVEEEPMPELEQEAPVEEEPMLELEQEAPVEEEPMLELEQEVPVEEEPMLELELEAPAGDVSETISCGTGMSVEAIVAEVNGVTEEKKTSFSDGLELSIGENGASYIALLLSDEQKAKISMELLGQEVPVLMVGNSVCITTPEKMIKKNLLTDQLVVKEMNPTVAAAINQSIQGSACNNLAKIQDNDALNMLIDHMLMICQDLASVETINQLLAEKNSSLKLVLGEDGSYVVRDTNQTNHSLEEVLWVLSY